jgi:hypothetical protein
LNRGKCALAVAAIAGSIPVGATTSEGATVVKSPMICSRGTDPQYFKARTTAPETAAPGSVFAVRIDSFPSDTISNIALNYVHEMATDYLLPEGASYVAESGRIVPDTGTENVRAGARVLNEGSLVRIYLPARVESGSFYTTPSLEFRVKVTARAGALLPLQFVQHRTTVNVVLVGDIHVACEPKPNPLTIASTRVIAPVP